MVRQGSSGIAWTDETWNPATGCSKVSLGCEHCYGESMSRRTRRDRWKPWTRANEHSNVLTHEGRLRDPFRWYEPRRVFVCSMGDLFHERLSDSVVADVFGIMGAAWWHTFQVLTKRPERMCGFLTMCAYKINQRVFHWSGELLDGAFRAKTYARREGYGIGLPPWPLPNVWVGTSVEDQRRADERIPHLLGTPAVLRFVSCEPLLGPIDFSDEPTDALSTMGRWSYLDELDWMIVGGESGPRARPMHPEWVRSIRDQCREVGVPFFLKQMGTAWAKGGAIRERGDDYLGKLDYKGAKPEQWPEDLRVREMPARWTQAGAGR